MKNRTAGERESTEATRSQRRPFPFDCRSARNPLRDLLEALAAVEDRRPHLAGGGAPRNAPARPRGSPDYFACGSSFKSDFAG